jgi:hypothetical protein
MKTLYALLRHECYIPPPPSHPPWWMFKVVDLVQAMKAYKGSRGIAPLFLNLGSRWWRGINVGSQPLYTGDETTMNRRLGGVRIYKVSLYPLSWNFLESNNFKRLDITLCRITSAKHSLQCVRALKIFHLLLPATEGPRDIKIINRLISLITTNVIRAPSHLAKYRHVTGNT